MESYVIPCHDSQKPILSKVIYKNVWYLIIAIVNRIWSSSIEFELKNYYLPKNESVKYKSYFVQRYFCTSLDLCSCYFSIAKTIWSYDKLTQHSYNYSFLTYIKIVIQDPMQFSFPLTYSINKLYVFLVKRKV